MDKVPNPALDRYTVHFRSFTPYSCGDTIGKPQTDQPAKVTCTVCRSEYQRLTDPGFIAAEASRQIHQIKAVCREWGAAADDTACTVTLADGQAIRIKTGLGAVAELRGLGYQVG